MAVEEEAVAVLAVLAVVLDLQAVRLAHLAVLAGPPVALLEVRDQQAAALQGQYPHLLLVPVRRVLLVLPVPLPRMGVLHLPLGGLLHLLREVVLQGQCLLLGVRIFVRVRRLLGIIGGLPFGWSGRWIVHFWCRW